MKEREDDIARKVWLTNVLLKPKALVERAASTQHKTVDKFASAVFNQHSSAEAMLQRRHDLAEKRKQEEQAEAEKRRQEERAEAEKRRQEERAEAEKRRQEERAEAEKRQMPVKKSPSTIEPGNCLSDYELSSVKPPRSRGSVKRGRGGGRASSRTPSPRGSASSDDAGSAEKTLYHTITKTLQMLSSRIDNLQQRQPLEVAASDGQSGKGQKQTRKLSSGKSDDKKGNLGDGEKNDKKRAASGSKTPRRRSPSSSESEQSSVQPQKPSNAQQNKKKKKDDSSDSEC